MRMDTRIPLGVNNFDIGAAYGTANQLAADGMALRQQNALANLYRTQGAGIMAGDQNALNALAGVDPRAAMDFQSARLGMDAQRQDMAATQQRMDMLTREEKRQLEAIKAEKGAAAAAQAAQELEDAVKMGMAIPDAATWDQFMSQHSPELVGQFNNRQAIANRYLSMADVLKQNTPANAGDRFKVVGSQLVDLTAEGGPKAVLTAPGQTETIYGPDGKPILTRGQGVSGKALTEGQSKDLTFATRARGALADLEGGNPNALTSRTNTILDAIPLGFGRELQSPDYQTAQNAGNEFLQAILRKDTGAAITADEQRLYGETYLPQPGDSPEKLAQKAKARARALAALEAGMPADAILRQENALSGGASQPTVLDGYQIEEIK